MRAISALVLSCTLATSPALADAQFWDVNLATIQKVDAEVAKLNFKGVCPPMRIAEFGRYYGGFTEPSGRRVIVGQLRSLKTLGHPLRPNYPPEAEEGIHIVHGSPIGIMDGGCSVANVWFDADTLKLVQAVWGGR